MKTLRRHFRGWECAKEPILLLLFHTLTREMATLVRFLIRNAHENYHAGPEYPVTLYLNI